MLQTLRSDAKINSLNPNLNVTMFNKGVQRYLEVTLVFPLYLIKRCFEETVLQTLRFKQLFFKATFFKDIFLWIFNLEQKIIVPSKHGIN